MKRKIVCGIMAVLTLATVALSGCKNGEDSSSRLPEPTQIILNAEDLALNVGETFDLRVADEELFWNEAVYSSSNLEVATVSKDGVLTALGAGETTVTVTFGERSSTLVVTVTAPQKTYALTLDKNDMTLGVGSNVTVTATVTLGGEQTQDTVSWSVTGEETEVEYSVNANELSLKVLEVGSYTVTAKFGEFSKKVTVTATETGDFTEYLPDQKLTVEEVMAMGFAETSTNWASKDYLSLWRAMTTEDYEGASQADVYYNGAKGVTAQETVKGTTNNVGLVLAPELLKMAVEKGNTHLTVTWSSSANSHTFVASTYFSGVTSGTKTFALSDLETDGEYAFSMRTHGAWWCAYLYVSSLTFSNPVAELLADALVEGTDLATEKFVDLFTGTGTVTYNEGIRVTQTANGGNMSLAPEILQGAVKAGYTKLTVKVMPGTSTHSKVWCSVKAGENAVFNTNTEGGTEQTFEINLEDCLVEDVYVLTFSAAGGWSGVYASFYNTVTSLKFSK